MSAPDVGGRLHRDEIAGIDEDLADQVERLLRARRDHHVLGVGVDALVGHQRDQPLAERQVTLSAGVLQDRRTVDVERVGDDRQDVLGRQRLDVRHATRERDDLGTRGNGEQRAHLGGGHAGSTVGV